MVREGSKVDCKRDMSVMEKLHVRSVVASGRFLVCGHISAD